MKKILPLMSVFALLTLDSCGIYTHYKPVSEVPEDLYGGSEVQVDTTRSLGLVRWQDMFTDSDLQALITKALQQNTDYLTAQLRIEEAKATLTAARLAFLPSFALAPQGVVSSFDGGKATQTYSLPVTASWQLDVFGNLRNAKEQSKALYAQSLDYAQAVQSSLVANLANAYYTLLMLDSQLAIAQATEQSWKESLETTRALKEAGMVTEAAVAQSEAAYYSVSTSVLDLKEQINQVQNSICQILAESPHTIQRGRLEDQVLTDNLCTGIPVQLLDSRPDVRVAERNMESAFYAVNQARSAFYPSITLSGNAGWTNSAGSMIINPAKFLASAVGSLTQPLFANGKLTAQLKIAKARQEETALAFQQTLYNAGVEVNNALSQYQTTTEKTQLYEKQVVSLESAVESTELLMRHGTTTYLEVLTARQSLLNARLTQTANRMQQLQAVVSLYQALGGGAE